MEPTLFDRSEALPEIVVHVPLEGAATAQILCTSYEEERRLALELAHRDLLDDIIAALLALLAVLDGQEA